MAAPFNPARDMGALRGLAHQFANLMQVVNGNLELLDGQITDQPGRRYLANARAAAAELSELSRSLSEKVRG